MNPATLPVEMLVPESRRIHQLRRGETGYAMFTALRADSRGKCYLQGSDRLEEGGMLKIEVRRDEKGFHVVVPRDQKVMRLTRSSRLIFFFSLIPVATVTIGPPRTTQL